MAVERDDYLPHQIRLFFVKINGSVHNAVGCVCRQNQYGKCEVMGIVDGGASPWPIYNKHDNHSPHAAEKFDHEWEGGPPATRSAEANRLRQAGKPVLDELVCPGDEVRTC